MEEKLIGALIGIARATDGSEHLITPEVTAFLRRALQENTADEAVASRLVKEAEEVKRSMVPNCFLCANPCGRTSDYDLKEMRRESQAVREKKEAILAVLRNPDALSDGAIYRGLFAIGLEGYTPEELQSVFEG